MTTRGTWKRREREMARDVGTERIPVTGERDGADFEDGIGCYQLKHRACIPGWLWGWLTGIGGTAKRKGKAGVLVLSRPGRPRSESVVVLSWADWTSLHGEPPEQGREGGTT